MRAFFAFLMIVLALSTQSCRQCTTCTAYPAPTEKLCKKDYASDDSYTQAFHHLEAQGYKCD